MSDTNETKEWIKDAVLCLLENQEYHEISMKQIAEEAHIGRRTLYRYFNTKDEVMKYVAESLMDNFAQKILINQASTLEDISQSYFEFWEENLSILLLLEKAHLLYIIENNLGSLMMEVAKKTKFKDKPYPVLTKEEYEMYLYHFYFRIAGFWKLTLVWCHESPRKTPKEMSQVMVKVIEG
ncbi:MAG: TetR/AcrR family transcriptional regulator [Cellulosilyticum sp.]|nr:TetR/AcrR family transcriptional regulator [Cellulosilyticum sp.]